MEPVDLCISYYSMCLEGTTKVNCNVYYIMK